ALTNPRSAVLDGDVVRCAADRLLAGVLAGPGLLLDDVVPVSDDGGAAELGGPQLARLAGDLRLHERRPVAAGALADDGPRVGVPARDLRLGADARGGLLRAVLPVPRRQIGGPT